VSVVMKSAGHEFAFFWYVAAMALCLIASLWMPDTGREVISR